MNSRIGMMRCSDGTLHYFLDGVDQGVACTDIAHGKHTIYSLPYFIPWTINRDLKEAPTISTIT